MSQKRRGKWSSRGHVVNLVLEHWAGDAAQCQVWGEVFVAGLGGMCKI